MSFTHSFIKHMLYIIHVLRGTSYQDHTKVGEDKRKTESLPAKISLADHPGSWQQSSPSPVGKSNKKL